MPGDGIVEIGAKFDKTNVDAGLGETKEMVKASMDAISASIVEANAKSKAAWKNLGDEVKNSVGSMNAEALRLAETTRIAAEAQADLRRAVILSKDAKIGDALGTAALAAAQTRVAATSADVSAAYRAKGRAAAEAAEEESLSSNQVIAAFQRMALSVRESLESVQEKMIETAETSGLEADGISAGFSGLTKLFGAGLAAGFVAHYVDDLAKVNVELDHLATKAGMSITDVAGLQLVMKEAGGDFEAAATGLVRMESNVQKLSEGAPQELADAFTNLGLKLDDVKKAKAPELLQMIATGMANTADQNIRANSAIAIFGRGGQALIPILVEQGAQLTANIRKAGELTKTTDESGEAARRWTRDMALLSAEFSGVMMPAMEHAEDVFRGVAGAAEAGAAVILTAFEGVGTAIASVLMPLYRYGVLMKDVVTGNWGSLKADVEAQSHAFTDTWKAGFTEIKAYWQETYHTFTDRTPLPPIPKGTDNPLKVALAAQEAMRRYETELNGLKIAHAMSVQDEAEFWKRKLAAATGGSDEYAALQAKLAPLMQEIRKGAGGSGLKLDSEGLNDLKLDHKVTLDEEIDFWQKRLAVAAKGGAEYLAIRSRLAALMQKQTAFGRDEAELSKIRAEHQLTIEEEIRFWQGKLAAASAGSKEYSEILKKISEAQVRGPQAQHEDMSGVAAGYFNDEVKANDNAIKEGLEAARAAAEEKIRIAHEDYLDVEKNADFEVEMDRMSAQKRLAILREAAAQENQVRVQQSKFIETLDSNDPKRYEADLRREEQDVREYCRQVEQMNRQAALKIQQYWKAGFNTINQDLTQLLNDYMKGTKNMEQVFARMLQGILEKTADWVLQMELKDAEMWAAKRLNQTTGQAAQAALAGAANAGTVVADAGLAGAGTMAYYAPINPIAAPALASAAVAQTMAFGAAAVTHDTGGMLRHGGLAINTSGAAERVLSPAQTSNFERMVNQSSSASTVNHNTTHLTQNLNGYDRAGLKSALRSHADDILDIVRSGYRSGQLTG